MEELTEIAGPTEREIVAKLSRLAAIREAKRRLAKEDETISNEVKAYLERTGQQQVTDGETGVTARLQVRQKGPYYDVMSMPDTLVCRLKALGVLAVDVNAARALAGKAPELLDLRRYETPGGTISTLVLDREEEAG